MDITTVLRQHGATTVPARSGWAAMRCPYHTDSDASASVNATLGRFRCHGCGVHGDAIDLIRHMDGVGYREAVEIAARMGVSTPAPRTAARRYVPMRGRVA